MIIHFRFNFTVFILLVFFNKGVNHFNDRNTGTNFQLFMIYDL